MAHLENSDSFSYSIPLKSPLQCFLQTPMWRCCPSEYHIITLTGPAAPVQELRSLGALLLSSPTQQHNHSARILSHPHNNRVAQPVLFFRQRSQGSESLSDS